MAAREDSEVKDQFEENQQMIVQEKKYTEYMEKRYKEPRENVEDSKKEDSPKK